MIRRKHFLSSYCHVCKKSNPEVNCGICKMVFYCCVEHRRQDWRAHSHLCRAIHKLCLSRGVTRIYESIVGKSPEDYRNIRHRTAMECAELMERNLESWELEILYWPKICGVCFDQSTDLDPCHQCMFVYGCRGVHEKTDHGIWCSHLRLYQEIVKHVEEKGVPKIPRILLPEGFSSMQDILQLEENKTDPVVRACASELLTYPLTVLKVIKNHCERGTITIHVVGAELQAEVLPLNKWEDYLLHLMPNCQQLTMIFIGPDLELPQETLDQGFLPLCDDCRMRERTLRYEIIANTLYHSMVSDSQPDLILAMNSGLYRPFGFKNVDSWAPTLEKIFTKEKPTLVLVTEYTSCEINKDCDLILKRYPAVKVLSPPTINEYASTWPNMNVISDDIVPVIFKNYFSLILLT